MNQSARVLLCVGCDTYEHLGNLSGAELDATNIFELFTSGPLASYALENSALLLSPTKTEILEKLDELTAHSTIDTLTFFFAGHGGVSRGSYYLCSREAQPGRFSTTSTTLTRIFELINERAPSQCNIILDSCASGGLVGDLSSLLKPELIGMSDSPGISIFASSASNQESLGSTDGGIGTNHLLKALRGEILVQEKSEYLDLVEIGRQIAADISEEVDTLIAAEMGKGFSSQSPVVWGLNLFGQSRFARNPHFKSNKRDEAPAISRMSDTGLEISKYSDEIWKLYYSSSFEITPQNIYKSLAPVIEKIESDGDVAQFVLGILSTFRSKTDESSECFARVHLLSTCIGLLLERGASNGPISQVIRTMLEQLEEELIQVFSEINDKLSENNKYLALNGFADFYYLPLRIAKLLGWIGALGLLSAELNHTDGRTKDLAKMLLQHLNDTYSANFVYLNDEQTTYLFTFFAYAFSNDLREQAEEILGFYSSDFFANQGKIASSRIAAKDTFQFITCRYEKDWTKIEHSLAAPCEALSMLLLMSHLYQTEETIDPYLQDLDHLSHSVYIPDSYIFFAKSVIKGGVNHTFQIGHGVWLVSDFLERWSLACVKQIENDGSLKHANVRFGALFSSLIFPNRVAWFIYPKTVDVGVKTFELS